MADQEFFIEKSETERIRIGISEFQDKRYVDIRQQFQADDGDWRPTRKGVTVSFDLWPEFREAVAGLEVPSE